MDLETTEIDAKVNESDVKIMEADQETTEMASEEINIATETTETDEKATKVNTEPTEPDKLTTEIDEKATEVAAKSVESDIVATEIDEVSIATEAATEIVESETVASEIDDKAMEEAIKIRELDIATTKIDTKITDLDTKITDTDTVISKVDTKSLEVDSSVMEMKKGKELAKENIYGVYSAIPEWTEVYVTNTIRLPRKREEVETTGKALPLEREEFKRRMSVIKKRKQELVEKAKIIDKRITEFEKFLQQDRAKLTEEAVKAEKERVKKQEEIARQKEQIDVFKKVLTELEKQIRHCQVFQDFVQRVADTSDEFTDASNIVDQYEILISLKAELVEKETLFQEEMETERVHMLQYYEEKHNEILRQKNELAALQISVTQAQNERLIWESKWNHTKETMSGKSLERAEINTSIRNLSSMISEYQEFLLHNEDVKEEPEKITMTLLSEKSSGNALDDEVIEQLQRIKEFILDWTVVVDEVKKSDHFASTKVHHLS